VPDNVIDGAQELLVDTVAALNGASIRDFVVIGGWCPYLRNNSGLRHPGTLDVDLLFRGGDREGALKPAIEALMQKGFILSAKHSFQLLLEKRVGNQRLVYNVDLLHPDESELHPEMFVDQLDLDIPMDAEERQVKKMKSIGSSNSAVVFEEKLYSEFSLKGATFNLIDFTGMFLTKMDSCQNVKRDRDAFDIYVGLLSKGINFDTVSRIREDEARVRKSLDRLIEHLSKDGELFNERVHKFLSPDHRAQESPALGLLRNLQVIG